MDKPRSSTAEIKDTGSSNSNYEDPELESKEKYSIYNIDKAVNIRKSNVSPHFDSVKDSKKSKRVQSVVPPNLPKVKIAHKFENLTPVISQERKQRNSHLFSLLKEIAPRLMIVPSQNSARSKSSSRTLESSVDMTRDRSNSGHIQLRKIELCL